MDKESLIAALREAESAKFAGIPEEDAVEHVFSDQFGKRMDRLIRVQRMSVWQAINSPPRRAAMMFLILILTFGVRPDQNPLFRYAQPVCPISTTVPTAPEMASRVRHAKAERAAEQHAAAARVHLRPETESDAEPEVTSRFETVASAPETPLIQSEPSAAPVLYDVPAFQNQPDTLPPEDASLTQGGGTEPAAAPEAQTSDAAADTPADADDGEKSLAEYHPLSQPVPEDNEGSAVGEELNPSGIFIPVPKQPYETPSYSGAYPSSVPRSNSWSDPSYYLPDISLPEILETP